MVSRNPNRKPAVICSGVWLPIWSRTPARIPAKIRKMIRAYWRFPNPVTHIEKSMPSTPPMEVMWRLIFQNSVMMPAATTQHNAAMMNRMTM